MRWTAGDQVAERLLAVELVAELLLAMLRLHFVVATRLPERVHCLLGVHDEPIGQLGSSAVLADGLGLVRALQEHAVSPLLQRGYNRLRAMGWQDKVLGWETVWHS